MACNDSVVPISFIHQKVFNAGHRLPKLKKLEIPKPLEATAARVISPTATALHPPQGTYSPSTGLSVVPRLHLTELFENKGDEWRYQFFYRGVTIGTAVCRWCAMMVQTHTLMDRHADSCYQRIRAVMTEFATANQCIVCKNEIDHVKMVRDYHRIPLCGSLACWSQWRHGSPTHYNAMQAAIKTAASRHEVLKSGPRN